MYGTGCVTAEHLVLLLHSQWCAQFTAVQYCALLCAAQSTCASSTYYTVIHGYVCAMHCAVLVHVTCALLEVRRITFFQRTSCGAHCMAPNWRPWRIGPFLLCIFCLQCVQQVSTITGFQEARHRIECTVHCWMIVKTFPRPAFCPLCSCKFRYWSLWHDALP